jgi:hypothetical protein
MTTSPESLALLGRAAELRAASTPWSDAAAQLAIGTEELRRLASENARDYDRLMRRARAEVLRESLDAALTTLRGLLKSSETGIGMKAATTIVRYDLARMRHGEKEAGARLERDARRSHRCGHEPETPSTEAKNPRAQNMPESPKVPTQQEVNPAKKEAQPHAPEAPATRPAARQTRTRFAGSRLSTRPCWDTWFQPRRSRRVRPRPWRSIGSCAGGSRRDS